MKYEIGTILYHTMFKSYGVIVGYQNDFTYDVKIDINLFTDNTVTWSNPNVILVDKTDPYLSVGLIELHKSLTKFDIESLKEEIKNIINNLIKVLNNEQE
jgi:hypothetical protein